MTRFQWFSLGHAKIPLELGILSSDDFGLYIKYCVFLDFIAQGNEKTTAITLASDRVGCSERTIYRAISYFDETVSK
jgi:hypothetical protein